MANTDRCPDCGAAYALVGFRHRCVAKSSGGVVESGHEASRGAPRTVKSGGDFLRDDSEGFGPPHPGCAAGEARGAGVAASPPDQKSAPAREGSLPSGETDPAVMLDSAGAEPTSTYRYRDAEKRRAYQREYMKAYRSRA